MPLKSRDAARDVNGPGLRPGPFSEALQDGPMVRAFRPSVVGIEQRGLKSGTPSSEGLRVVGVESDP
jgi:hypothetical protein